MTAETSSARSMSSRIPLALRYPLEMLAHPRRTTDRLVGEPIRPAMLFVLGYGVATAAGFAASAADYPPPSDVLATWIDAYGEFTMLPFINIPPDGYRLVLAVVAVPLMAVVWVLMAGFARLLTAVLGGRATFDDYLSLTAFAFLPFWIIVAVIDTIHSGPLGGLVVDALRGEHGSIARAVAVNFMPVAYVVLFGLGGLWCAVTAARANAFGAAKSGVIGLACAVWPLGTGALLFR